LNKHNRIKKFELNRKKYQMKKHTFILLFFNILSYTCLSQGIYSMVENETIEAFVSRNFPETTDKIVHKVISGNWGDSLHPNKIIFFYQNDSLQENQTCGIVLQKISNNSYKKLKLSHSFGIGVYPRTSTIESVFFYDTNKDGLKELIVVEKGSRRCSTELSEYNEKTKKYETSVGMATCDICGYIIFGQNVDSDIIKILGSDENDEWKCDAKTIKTVLKLTD